MVYIYIVVLNPKPFTIEVYEMVYTSVPRWLDEASKKTTVHTSPVKNIS